MKQKTFSLLSALILAGVIATPSMAGIKFMEAKMPKPRTYTIREYLSDKNQAMEQALLIHNLMNEMPELKETATSLSGMDRQSKLMSETLEVINSCNVKKMGKVFKDPEKVWGKMMDAYDQRRQSAQKGNKSPITNPQQRQASEKVSWDINREIMMDVYQNPEKWGSTNKDASFPLWKDQAILFEKQWNNFYENINMAYGAVKGGRPAVSADVRQDAKKYNQVLAAHKAYIAQIGKGKKVDPKIAKAMPPKAPTALPEWQNVVRLDAQGKLYPEIPEPWKQMSANQFQNYSNQGEMGQVFEGKSLTPSKELTGNVSGDLEKQYDAVLVVDSLQKGVKEFANAQKGMVDPFAEQLVSVGVNIPGFDITNAKHYQQAFEQLKALKKKSIADAYKYVQRLEEQDKKNPELVARRNKILSQKKSRLPAEAQSANSELAQILQTGQMSPSVRQRLVLSALETDEDAIVYLTETNATNIDQLMREGHATRKLLADSQHQFKYALDKQNELKPQMAKCQF